MRLNLYGQNRHIVLINGLPLAGFAEGDFMTVEKEGNAASRTLGGDGPAMNLSTEQGGKISVALLPTSPALGALTALRENQRTSPSLFNIILVSGVEEVINATGCAFAKLPSFKTGGEKMSERVFDFECLEIQLDTSGINPLV